MSFKDTMSSRRVDDELEDQRKYNLINPWSDMEKCIFFDRFLQHPKDFRKIASFLKNKCAHDCIAFYYNSKQSVPYKAALKEHQMRKRKRGDVISWEATIQAALSLGATVTAGLDSEKPLLFHLPPNDQTFTTRLLHPIKPELFALDNIKKVDTKEPKPRKKKSALATTFTLDIAERKFLRAADSGMGKKSNSFSDAESMSSAKLSRSSSLMSVSDAKSGGETEADSGNKKTSSKWSDNEKAIFFESLENLDHKKNWKLLSEAIGTKTAAQTKNFYYENKKQNGKGKGNDQDSSKPANKEGETKKSKNGPSGQSHSTSHEKVLSGDQIAMLAQLDQAGGMQMPAPENKAVACEPMSGIITNPNVNFAANQQQVAWHDSNQQRQYAFLEQQRIDHQRLEQQRLEQQRLYEQQQHQLDHLELAQQHLLGQHQRMQHQHIFDAVAGGIPPWLAAQVLRQQQQQDLQSNQHLQNIALAMQQLQQQQQHQRQQQQQNTLHLQQNGGMQAMNQTGDLEQQAQGDLSLLARIADASRSNQHNRNL